MTGLHLKLRSQPSGDWDASSLGADLLRLTAREAAALPLRRLGSNQVLSAGELFEVSPRSDASVVIEGDLSRFHAVGAGWNGGVLSVEGNVGNGFASQMAGGSVSLRGDAPDGVATQMSGGRLRIEGNVGDALGQPLPGRRSGLSGGRVIVTGNCGQAAGYRMRRGTLVLLGDCAEWLGRDMVAGTIVVAGTPGEQIGAGMRRGTIVVPASAHLSQVRFSDACPQQLVFAHLLAADLQPDSAELSRAMERPVRRALGDLSAGGMGEVWLYQQHTR